MPSHSETRTLPYSARQMYDLVADVDKYPQFIPWASAARVRSVEPHSDHDLMLADLVVGFKMFRERFVSRVTLFETKGPSGRPQIDTEYVDGPFKHMQSTWSFEETPRGCNVHFEVDFEFKNRLLQGAAGLFFHEAMQRIVRAFEARAAAIYGDDVDAATA